MRLAISSVYIGVLLAAESSNYIVLSACVYEEPCLRIFVDHNQATWSRLPLLMISDGVSRHLVLRFHPC